MRYQEGTPIEPTYEIHPGLWYASAGYGLVLGLVILFVGLRVRRMLLWFWGGVLTLGSLGFLGALLLGRA
jgi:hypothetical protein